MNQLKYGIAAGSESKQSKGAGRQSIFVTNALHYYIPCVSLRANGGSITSRRSTHTYNMAVLKP